MRAGLRGLKEGAETRFSRGKDIQLTEFFNPMKSVQLQKQCMLLVNIKSRHANNDHDLGGGGWQCVAAFPSLERLRQQNHELGHDGDLASKGNK